MSVDSAPGMSGYSAGIMPGMRLTHVNAVKFSVGQIEEAVRRTRDQGKLELQVANGHATELHRLDYHGGLRYPHLQREPSKPDLLRLIVAPQTTVATAQNP